ncbi:MAG: MGH1-like glycoside hydrolase domain-containing protein [Acutalibacteraceae bacterium]
MKKLDNVFPLWGPYGKKYLGISRVADESMKEGVRFDFTVSPTIFASDAKVPNSTFMCGVRAWQCSSDYSFFSYRFDLEGKDDVYAIVSYVRLNDDEILTRTEVFNNTEVTQNILINYFSSMEYREETYTLLKKPENCVYVDAADYKSYEYAIGRPWDEENPDAWIKGVFPDEKFVSGRGLGDRCPKWHLPHRYLAPFGGEKGDRVTYDIEKKSFNSPVLVIRYRSSGIHYEQGKQVGVHYVKGDKEAVFTLCGGKKIILPVSDELRIIKIPLDYTPERLDFVSEGEGAVEFDFFAVCDEKDADKFEVITKQHEFIPEIEETKTASGYRARLTYGEGRGEYNIYSLSENTRFRKIETGCLEDCLNVRLSNNDESFDDLTETFSGSFSRKKSDFGFFHNMLIHTIFCQKHSCVTEYAVVSKGEHTCLTKEEYEAAYREKLRQYKPFTLENPGEKYSLSNELLRAAVMTNVVYPIYKHGRYIIHHTPGKRWDCLYTWDSGFIGLGMIEYAPQFARYILETYLSDKDNPDYAFVHHGSIVPVQFYLYRELVCRGYAEDEEYYDKMKLYYDFFLGKIRSSTTAKFKSGLLTTYDYFYSCSGMDDYPAQVKMMKDNIRDTTAPVLTSAHAVRIAKIMLESAEKLGLEEDAAAYREDIKKLTKALNTYSWDKKSGFYSYVLHDKYYNPTGKYVLPDGENLNRGLDGIYPIMANICDKEQTEAVLSHLKDEKCMLSPYGISAVDMEASYFRNNGYWNGNVWFSHQWFLFKAMLDIGEADFAFEIANRALEVWKREVEYSYYTFEMVSVVTGRGGWFHNFGGLSTPVNMWACAYYKKGSVTTGFDTFTKKCVFNDDFTEAHISVRKKCENESVVLVCMAGSENYSVTSEQAKLEYYQRHNGEIEVKLPEGVKNIDFIVKKF